MDFADYCSKISQIVFGLISPICNSLIFNLQ